MVSCCLLQNNRAPSHHFPLEISELLKPNTEPGSIFILERADCRSSNIHTAWRSKWISHRDVYISNLLRTCAFYAFIAWAKLCAYRPDYISNEKVLQICLRASYVVIRIHTLCFAFQSVLRICSKFVNTPIWIWSVTMPCNIYVIIRTN